MKSTTRKNSLPQTNNTRQLTKNETEFSRGLHEFASQAYTAALDYYSKHYNDPAALKKRKPLPAIRDTHPEWIRLSEAISVIVTSEATPAKLYNSTIDYLSSNSGELWGRLMVTPEMIQRILVAASVKEELQAKEEAAQ